MTTGDSSNYTDECLENCANIPPGMSFVVVGVVANDSQAWDRVRNLA